LEWRATFTEKYPGHNGVSVKAFLVSHVAEGDSVQLCSTAATGCIDGEQDGPGQAAANNANDDDHSKETQEQICLQRGMA
jgi:hypothetical protein